MTQTTSTVARSHRGLIEAAATPGAVSARDKGGLGRLNPPPLVEHLIGQERRRWWALIGIWVAVALAVATGTFVAELALGRQQSWLALIAMHIPFWTCWALACPPAYSQLHRLLSLKGRRVLAAFALVGICLAVSMLSSVVTYVVAAALLGREPSWFAFVDRYVGGGSGVSFQVMNVGVFLTACVGLLVIRNGRLRDLARHESALAAIQNATLELQLAEARLRALQSQVNPHFLFNALNNIATLVRLGESERAFDVIGQLGNLLRAALRSSEQAWSTLGEELDFIEQYLAMCKLRMESHLHWRSAVPSTLRPFRVPSMILQPLVENCIKHGAAQSAPLNIDLRAWQSGKYLCIEISDDGSGIDPAVCCSLPKGHGLRNVAERIRLLCSPEGRFSIGPRSARGTIARLTICPPAAEAAANPQL